MTDAVENTQAEETTSAKTYTEAEVNELVAGLKKNNEALLAEKKEAARIAKEAKDAQILADQERAKRDGDLSTLEKSLTEQFGKQISEKDARLTMMSERILGAERKSVINSLSGMLVDESAADILGMMVKTEFDGDDVVTKFVDASGNVITTDPAQFKKYLSEHKAFSHLVKADAATGGGAGGNKKPAGGAGGNLDAIDQRLQQKFGKRG